MKPSSDDPLLSEAAERAATDRIAWAMLCATEPQSPRMVWAEQADEWREYASGVWRAALEAARNAEAKMQTAWIGDRPLRSPNAGMPTRERFEDDSDLSRWTWLRAARHELHCEECRVTWRSWAQRLLGIRAGYSPKV